MKRLFFILLLLVSSSAWSQMSGLPNSPLDANMGEAIGQTAQDINILTPNPEQQKQQEELREKELLENRYDVPEDDEDYKFNKNGTME